MINGIGGIGSIGSIGTAGGIGNGVNGAGGAGGSAATQALRTLDGSAATTAGGPVARPDFLQALQAAAGEAAQTVRTAELHSIAGVVGKADIRTVVDQVMAAERTLSAGMAIRNKLVAAWQEISRMQI